MIPIFTSLPPQISRKRPDGSEIGPAYLAQCIDSWRASGFDPYTVNASDEELGDLPEQLGIRRLTTSRDARGLVGKPLLFINDFFEVIRKNVSGPVAIVNADIHVDLSGEARAVFAGLQPGECGFFSRTDITQVDHRHGEVHHLGKDLFLFHSNDLQNIDADTFVMGVPWWDHFIPVAARLSGLRSVASTGVGVYHLSHEEAWDQELWRRYGAHFKTVARKRALRSARPCAKRYAQALNKASVLSPSRPRQMLRSVLRSFSLGGRQTNLTFNLYNLGRVNMSLINGEFD